MRGMAARRFFAAVAVTLAVVAALRGATATASQARLVHPLLPWHAAVRDGQGGLLPWYRPDAGLGYDHVLRLGWRFLERRVPKDRRTGAKVYLHYPVFDGRTLQGRYWQHNPAFLFASFVDSVLGWFPYSGDHAAVDVVREMLDYELAHGTTPRSYAWPSVPFATSCAGERTYGRCLAGIARRRFGGTEPDKAGLLGLGYARFYELTGDRRYLAAAISAANALARHVRAGGAGRTPWPFRVDARTGRTLGGAEFGGMVVGPIRLFDELIRIGAGRTRAYARARSLALSWLLRYQLNAKSPTWNRWSGFYEDVPYNPDNRNQAVPTMTADYLVTRRTTVDPQWRDHAAALLDWVRTSLGRGPFVGAWAIDEQRAPGRPGCCSPAGLGSTTSRWAAVNARLYAATGDEEIRERTVRSLGYATYFVASDGRISCCGTRGFNEYWFSDGYADYLRSFNWAMAAIPELAPTGQDHVLGSSSVVRAVSYGKGRLDYRTFDRRSVEVLRLSYRPNRVRAGAATLAERRDVGAEGYVVRQLSTGDFVVRIRHDHATRIHVRAGKG
jgi:hypothetical protein